MSTNRTLAKPIHRTDLSPRIGAVWLLLCLSLLPAPSAAEAMSSPEEPRGRIVLGPPRPVDPDRLSRMRTWHPRYRAAMRPIGRALRSVLEHPGPADNPRFLATCMELEDALLGLDRRVMLPAPDYAVTRHVQRALFELGEAASSCISEADRTMRYRLRKAEEALRDTALALRPYRLKP